QRNVFAMVERILKLRIVSATITSRSTMPPLFPRLSSCIVIPGEAINGESTVRDDPAIRQCRHPMIRIEAASLECERVAGSYRGVSRGVQLITHRCRHGLALRASKRQAD